DGACCTIRPAGPVPAEKYICRGRAISRSVRNIVEDDLIGDMRTHRARPRECARADTWQAQPLPAPYAAASSRGSANGGPSHGLTGASLVVPFHIAPLHTAPPQAGDGRCNHRSELAAPPTLLRSHAGGVAGRQAVRCLLFHAQPLSRPRPPHRPLLVQDQ